jgi:hypothetical protein
VRDSARGPGTQQYKAEQEFSTAAKYLDAVRQSCGSQEWPGGQKWPKDFICLSLVADPLPFEEKVEERLYRLACDHNGRIEGCEGYAKLMDLRGEPARAREYRERAGQLPAARVAPPRSGPVMKVGPLHIRVK